MTVSLIFKKGVKFDLIYAVYEYNVIPVTIQR